MHITIHRDIHVYAKNCSVREFLALNGADEHVGAIPT